MVRLTDLPEYERAHLLGKNLSPLEPPAWVDDRRSLAERRMALVTTAGLHRRDDPAFEMTDASYRVLPARDADELVMSHSSVNYDRTGFMEDVNLVLPVDRFRELERAGTIGSLSDLHYSFMGAGLMPDGYAQSAAALAAVLHRDEVDTVFLTPV